MPSTAKPGCDPATARAKFPTLDALIGYLDGLRGRADLDTLSGHLSDLRVTRADLEPAIAFGTRSYRRNTIAHSPYFELLALCWRSGHCTPIHDHRGSSCAFRVVEGVGTEIRFSPTASGLICPGIVTPMKPGYVCAAQDDDIHQIANMQAPGADLITLHIYSPPLTRMHTYGYATSAGAEGCEIYDLREEC